MSHTSPNISVRMDPDAMRAVLTIEAGFKPTAGSRALCVQQFVSLGIPKSRELEDLVDEGLERCVESPKEPCHIEVCGEPPIDGEDGAVEWQVGASITEEIDDGSRIDHYGRSQIACVRKGQELAVIRPPEPGKPGCDLLGRHVAAQDGKAARVEHDDSVIYERSRLIAARAGAVVREGHAVRVTDSLLIEGQIDFSTGSLDFDGSIEARGGICDNFRVTVSKDLTIHGTIEGAILDIKGDLTAHAGIAGRDKARVTVGECARMRYLSNARAEIGRDLFVVKEILASHIVVGGSLRMERGVLAGGEMHVLGPAVVGTLGSPGHVPTLVHLGSSPRISTALASLRDELTRIDRESAHVRHEASLLESQRSIGEFSAARLAQLRERIAKWDARVEQLRAMLHDLESTYTQLRNPEITVTERLHTGAVLFADGWRAAFHADVRGPVTILLGSDGKFLVRDNRDGATTPLLGIARIERSTHACEQAA